jgi:hypothetical protein
VTSGGYVITNEESLHILNEHLGVVKTLSDAGNPKPFVWFIRIVDLASGADLMR